MAHRVFRLETRVKPDKGHAAAHARVLARQLPDRDDLAKLGKVMLYIIAREVLGQARHVQVRILDQLRAGPGIGHFDLLILNASPIQLLHRSGRIILMSKLT